jgi:hypothetical protein
MTVEQDAGQRDQDGVSVNGVGLERLPREESLELLGSVPIGRMVYTRQALPAVDPVNFALSSGEIVIRSGTGRTLAAAARGDVVAFEADAPDTTASPGWSVTVIGRSRQAGAAEEISRLGQLGLVSWTPGEHDHFICIGIEIVTGQLLRPSRGQPLPDERGAAVPDRACID